MGHGIAHVSAVAGYDTVLSDVDQSVLDAARTKISANLDGAVKRDKLTREAADAALDRVRFEVGLEAACAEADIVVEAVPENMELKKTLLRQADAAAPAECLLASNTSSLSLTELQMATQRPERVVGLHFFNPVHIMKLVEVVRGERTTQATVDTALGYVETLRKEPIVVRDSPGFATSRLGIAIGNEAMRMFQEGVASAEDIDKAMTLGYRHPMGPLKLSDLVGLDVRLAITEHLYNELGSDTFRAPQVLRRMVRAGKLGRKSGEGFYTYDDA